MKRMICLCILLASVTVLPAQVLKRIKQRAENAVANKAGDAVEKEVNNAADKALSEKREPAGDVATTAKANKTNDTTGAPAKLMAYSKFDYVAGVKLLLAEDFSQDVIGEFPKEWNTDNHGEVVQLSDRTRNWLKLAYNTSYVSPFYQTFPENFTLEFDVIMDMHNKGWGYPEWFFHFYHASVPPTELKMKGGIQNTPNLVVRLVPSESGNSYIVLTQADASGSQQFKSPLQRIKLIEEEYGKPMHVAFSVQGQRLRMWINEQKIYDLPRVFPASAKLNQFALAISNCNYKEEDLGLYFSDLKIAAGLPDTRSKLLTEGKWSTTAISFDVNSDRIRESSLGAIKEVAEILRSNSGMKIRIVGHTDSDGGKEANQALSEKRARAVKQLLTELYHIEENRMETAGRGASEPASDNKTVLGKAQNRRVEFIRL